MIYIILNGHDFKYEIGELIKLFFFQQKIEFLTEKALTLNSQAFLIENSVYIKEEKTYSETVVTKNGLIISREIESIDSVDILEDNSQKKLKIGIKKNIYKALSNLNKVDIPWGILTGIRPTKIIHSLSEKGFGDLEIEKMLLKEYLLSEKKIELISGIAKIERDYIYPLEKDRFSIYISIPFCPTRCVYCSFPSNSLNGKPQVPDVYLESLIKEIKNSAIIFGKKKIHTVYIGGGTPTTLSSLQLNRLMEVIHQYFSREDIEEITVEAGRPDTITADKLKVMKDWGVERISINPQTMNDQTLKQIGRSHSSKDIVEKFELTRKFGFKNINMDIIVGLPGEREAEIIHTMKEIEKLSPENLTVHTMAIKRSSSLKDNIKDYSLTEQLEIEKMLEITREFSEKMNLRPYYMYRQKQILGNFENIGYALEGRECIYNIMMMEEKETILAFGAGAISKIYYPLEDRFERVPNVKNLDDYINRVDEMVKRKSIFK
jgi:coproporphyrinogen dehydrogenase HemZ